MVLLEQTWLEPREKCPWIASWKLIIRTFVFGCQKYNSTPGKSNINFSKIMFWKQMTNTGLVLFLKTLLIIPKLIAVQEGLW